MWPGAKETHAMSRQGTLQHRPSAGTLFATLLVCLLFMPVNASAAEQVGRVLVAAGSVTAEQEDASARALGRRDPIYAGDRIRTSPRGRVQIRFEDGALVDLEPSSTFQVEEYASEADDEDGGGSAVMSFLAGAMRTITGAIGGNRSDDYRMTTTVATIGVRGTAYALEYCDAACAEDGGREGLYGRVDDGEVEVDGPGGIGVFGKGQYFFVPDGGAPERIVAPPDGILEGDGETGAGGDDDRIEDVSIKPLDTGDEDGAGLGSNDTDLLDPDFESAEITDLGPLRPGTSVSVGFGGAFIGSSGFAVYESPGGGDVRRDEEGRIVGAEFDGYDGFVDATDLDFNGGMTPIIDPESGETAFEVSWGSWTAEPGTIAEGDIAGFSYAVTDPGNFTTVTEIEALGSLEATGTYFDQGGPVAIDSSGATWSVAALQLGVDFGSGLTGAGIALEPVGGEQGAVLSVSNFPGGGTIGSIDPNDGTFAAAGLSADGGGDFSQVFEAEGALEGRFLGRNAEGALVAFELREVNGDRRVVGTRVLGRQGVEGGGDLVPIDGQ
jgi:hypothetical protein